MRAPALLLPLLAVILACKPDSGEDTGGSSSGDICSDEQLGDGDPNYSACSCEQTCESGLECRFTDMSSLCAPACTNGPSCKNAVDPCTDSDCPTLAGLTATCDGGRCLVYCTDQACPTGYVCVDSVCQVER